jgi:hypothetical protein
MVKWLSDYVHFRRRYLQGVFFEISVRLERTNRQLLPPVARPITGLNPSSFGPDMWLEGWRTGSRLELWRCKKGSLKPLHQLKVNQAREIKEAHHRHRP